MNSLRLFRRLSSTVSRSSKNERAIVVTDDASTIVCYHPESSFPYECTKPLPVNKVQDNSVLKVQNKDFVHEVFSKPNNEIVQQELMKMTYTTKHRWVPPKKMEKKLCSSKTCRQRIFII
uniref:Large ribosomal subunit protein mL42 n=1 Tax=Acyrthosiphon pisum TaxID=7029 RepID=C4WX47_ACYPI|nr:ACYPI009119 [Acyrthosiphon pisum]